MIRGAGYAIGLSTANGITRRAVAEPRKTEDAERRACKREKWKENEENVGRREGDSHVTSAACFRNFRVGIAADYRVPVRGTRPTMRGK